MGIGPTYVQTSTERCIFFVYAEPNRQHQYTNEHTHTNPPHPRSPPQQRPGSLSIRRETLDEGEGAGAAAT